MTREYKRINFNVPRPVYSHIERDQVEFGISDTDYFITGATVLHRLLSGELVLNAADGSIVHLVISGKDGMTEIPPQSERPNLQI